MKIKVLHIDDQEEILDLTREIIHNKSDIIEVTSEIDPTVIPGKASNFDCIVSDYNMPDMNGLELFKTLDKTHPEIPFILFTGKGNEDVASKAITAGVDEYLQKNATDCYDLLITRIKNIVSKRRTEREYNRAIEAIESASEAISILSDAGEFVYANNEYTDLVGYSTDELCNLHIEELYASEESKIEFWDDIIPIVTDTGEWSGKHIWVTKDGEKVHVDYTVSSSVDGSFICTAKDITNQYRREKTRDYNQTLLIKSLDDLSDVFYVLDEAGNVELWNKQLEEITGYTSGEIQDMHATDFFTEIDRSIVEETVEELLNGSESKYIRASYTTKDGRKVPYSFRSSSIFDEDGEVIGVSGIGYQIEDPETLQEEIENNQLSLSALYNISTDSHLNFEQKVERILAVGCDRLELPIAVVKKKAEERWIIEHILGTDLVPPGENIPLRESFCRNVCKTGGAVAEENILESYLQEDPAYSRWGFNTYIGAPIKYRGDFYGTLCFGSKETTEKEFSHFEITFVELLAEWISHELEVTVTIDKLKSKNERLSEFARTLSHDLRSSLGLASGGISLALETGEMEYIEDAGEAIQRIEEIITNLLSMIRTGDWASQKKHLSMKKVAESAWTYVETRNAELYVEDFDIFADELSLTQLLENVIRNAVEHGGESVKVRIRSLENGFRIEDTGVGFNNIDALFDSTNHTIVANGSLGLHIVQSIAESHGWEIELGSSRDGGARIDFQYCENSHN